MSFTQKVVTTYSKSLFQQYKTRSIAGETTSYKINDITSYSVEGEINLQDVFIIAEELLLIRSLIVSSRVMKEFFKNPTYPEEQKLNVILSIFPGLTSSVKSFLKVLTERSHLSLLPQITEEYTEMVLKFKESNTVKLVIATALKEAYGSLLLTTLRNLTNSKEIFLKVFYHPKLLGGLVIEYNSMSIDASILKEFSLFFNDI
jgi:ATP synthase F1 delta subunit